MAHGSVSRNAFRQKHALDEAFFVEHQLFNAPVLPSELDFKVQDVLAVADEAEMAGLDHSCVNGTDADLVELLAGHLKELVLVRHKVADWLVPRMSREAEAPILVDFALKTLECELLCGN